MGDGSRRSGRPGGRADRWVRAAGRAGFAARGVVYLLVGHLALRIAFGDDGSEEADRQGALHHVAEQPFGRVALWLLVAGFACMALWRASEALFGRGRGAHRIGSRFLNGGRAVFYAVVCWATAVFAAGAGASESSDTKSRDWTATLLGEPGGRYLVGAAGLVVIGVGVGAAVRGILRKFLKKLDTAAMSARTRTAVTAVGVAGTTSRGVVFTAVGLFVLLAAVRFDPGSAKGVDDTLRTFAATPAGPWLLALVAVGLLLFGVFSFTNARWRRL
ncbi:DUF1206 domain-containing protein [Kitasatospora sp. NPDC051853]|uniref:DUF1206 domain-containing protein n=1 Tax=Kitasatospora sp. NPDC051853 TaxID=3364058 RepID=UPI0037B087A8